LADWYCAIRSCLIQPFNNLFGCNTQLFEFLHNHVEILVVLRRRLAKHLLVFLAMGDNVFLQNSTHSLHSLVYSFDRIMLEPL
jgi:hypothetical protein